MSEGRRVRRTSRRVPVVEMWLLALRLAVALVIAAVIVLALITPASHTAVRPDPTPTRVLAASGR
jgi:hypothetical protein